MSSTQLNASAAVPGNFSYTPQLGTVLSVGTHTLTTSFKPNDTANYTTATDTVSINVIQATPTITWNNPADIIYGTALSGTQLDANASVPGNFAYTPTAGTVLSVGLHTLSTNFTPTDMVNYTTASQSVSINVSQATPTINWNNPADIIYGIDYTTAYATALINVIPAVQQGVSLTITKSAYSTSYDSVGQTITYTYNVTNSGNKNISAPITVTDDKAGTVSIQSSGVSLVHVQALQEQPPTK